jgi:hypothetical protein
VGTARTLLDQVHSLARVSELEANAGAYAEAISDELPAGPDREQPYAGALPAHEARDHALASALAHIDTTISRVMRIRLDHALASDPAADAALAAPTRNVFASTLGKYAHDLSLLAQRVRDTVARAGSRQPDAVAALVVDAAQSTLALRDALRGPVLELVRNVARSALPDAQAAATDRKRDDTERTRWSALRRELETLTARPEQVATAPLAQRLAALPAELDELPPEPDVSFADMIEMD